LAPVSAPITALRHREIALSLGIVIALNVNSTVISAAESRLACRH
jgi:hypothetical protein